MDCLLSKKYSRFLANLTTLYTCNAVEDGARALHAIARVPPMCSGVLRGRHARGSASRQRQGESHHVMLGEEAGHAT